MQRISSLIVCAAALLFVLPLVSIADSGRIFDQPREHANCDYGSAREPYVGEWSNGRGDTLVITAGTIKFGKDKAVSYRDVTRVTNGREFNLEITTDAKLNYLTKYLHISLGDGDKTGEMKMTLYDSRKDMEDGQNSQGEAMWDRDK